MKPSVVSHGRWSANSCVGGYSTTFCMQYSHTKASGNKIIQLRGYVLWFELWWFFMRPHFPVFIIITDEESSCICQGAIPLFHTSITVLCHRWLLLVIVDPSFSEGSLPSQVSMTIFHLYILFLTYLSLSGCVSLQFAMYWRTYPQDMWQIRSLVSSMAWLWCYKYLHYI